MRDVTDNEVGGFGVTDADDLLFVTDFVLVKQKVTPVSVSFDDEAVADYFEDQVEISRQPEQFARIWLHSHPGDSPEPSYTDEQTFARVFGSCDWAIMFIVAQDGKTFARLRFNAGPGGDVKIPVCVDYSYEFNAADFEVWQQQYLANVVEETVFSLNGKTKKSLNTQLEEAEVFGSTGFDSLAVSSSEDMIEELELMHPSERQAFMDELAVRSDFWDEYESEV
jgi:proteasome lid subunit RPN8/RPN11